VLSRREEKKDRGRRAEVKKVAVADEGMGTSLIFKRNIRKGKEIRS
jgi:hypothetical protein